MFRRTCSGACRRVIFFSFFKKRLEGDGEGGVCDTGGDGEPVNVRLIDGG